MGTCYGMGMGWGWIIPLILFVVLIYFFFGRNNSAKRGKTAKDILDERLARGEIDNEEYNRVLKIIEGGDDES